MKNKNNIVAKALLLPIIIANLNTNVFAINKNDNNLNNYTRETEYEADTWYYDFAPMPTPRGAVGAVTVGTKIYTIGGYSSSSSKDTVEVYDTLTDSWSTRASMPTARQNVKPVYNNGKIYVIGGGIESNPYTSNINTFEVYDIKKDTWESKASVPANAMIIGSVIFDGDIHVMSHSGEFFRYNEENDTWEEKTGSPGLSSAKNPQLKLIGGKLYFLSDVSRPNQNFYEYDKDTDSWTLLPTPIGTLLPTNIFNAFNDSVVINNRVYMSPVMFSQFLDIFDVENNIRLASSPSSIVATENTRMSAVGNKIYFIKRA